MKYGALLGWGIVIYAIMSLAWSGLTIYGFSVGVWPRVLEFLVLFFISQIAGRSLGFHTWKDIAPYSIGWAIIAAILDGVFTVPFSGWQLYSEWNVLAGYALVVILPLFAPSLSSLMRAPAPHHRPWES